MTMTLLLSNLKKKKEMHKHCSGFLENTDSDVQMMSSSFKSSMKQYLPELSVQRSQSKYKYTSLIKKNIKASLAAYVDLRIITNEIE